MFSSFISHRYTTFLLLLIFFGGIFLRFYNLTSIPAGFGRDEAYLGYNAYSILTTGKDMNGHLFPVFIESFLYTPAGYSYLSVPFIKLFGLSVFSVRFASALCGALSIPVLYYFVKLLLSLAVVKKIKAHQVELISLASAISLALLPWHINLSRTASVSTVVTILILLGGIFFLKAMQSKRTIYIVVAHFLFGLSLLFYIAPFSFIPFFLPILYWLGSRHLSGKLKISVIFYVLIVGFVAAVYLNPNLSLRMRSLSLTGNPLVPLILVEDTSRDGVFNIPPMVARAFHNKVSVTGSIFIDNYFKHFSYDFLFTERGFPDRYRVPESGLIFRIYIVFLLLGTYYLVKTDGKLKWFLLLWMLVAPIGSGFTSDDVPNLQRTLFLLPPLIIVASFGLVHFLYDTNIKRYIRLIFMVIAMLIFFYEAALYMHQYVVHENAYRPWYRQEGYQELINKVNSYKNKYKKIVITNRESAPTIFLLFFNTYDALRAQKIIEQSELRDTDRISFDVYTITEEECPVKVEVNPTTLKEELVGERGVLYVNSGLCNVEVLPKNVKVLDTILRSDNSKAFYLLEVVN